jgi:hypothetical protein
MSVLAERLEHYSIPEPNSGCLLWTAYANPAGYGVVCVPKKRATMLAHRAAWTVHRGPIPEGLHVCHKCDVPACINPDHLFLGTNDDNVADKVRKNRANKPVGVRNPRARLSESDVSAIRADMRTHEQIAADYGVARTTIGAVKSGRNWSSA